MIGFYDSGIGGLTILKEVLKIRPEISSSYFADFEILPLGDKSIDFIQNRIKKACSYLFLNGCDVVVLACNTASVNSIRHIQQVWLKENYKENQVLSITKPLTEQIIINLSDMENNLGLLLSTQATYNSGFYQYELLKSGFNNIISIPCVGLAESIEESDDQSVNMLLDNYILKYNIQRDKVKFIILACTHYKYSSNLIQKKFPNAIIVEPSEYCAVKLVDYLKKHTEYNSENGLQKYYFTQPHTVLEESHSINKLGNPENVSRVFI
jgi:glutamate racemase